MFKGSTENSAVGHHQMRDWDGWVVLRQSTEGETIWSQSLHKKKASSLIMLALFARTVKVWSSVDRARKSSCVICNGIWMGSRLRKTMSVSQPYLLALTMMMGPPLAACWRLGKSEGRRKRERPGGLRILITTLCSLRLRQHTLSCWPAPPPPHEVRALRMSKANCVNSSANVFPARLDTTASSNGERRRVSWLQETPRPCLRRSTAHHQQNVHCLWSSFRVCHRHHRPTDRKVLTLFPAMSFLYEVPTSTNKVTKRKN